MSTDPLPERPIVMKDGRRMAASKPLRARVAQYLHTKVQHPTATNGMIAEMMGLSRNGLGRIIKTAHEAGLLEFDDPLERVEYELIPKIVDNLNFFLDAKDKTITIEAAKGTLFRAYQESKGISDGNQTVLALKIERADSDGGEVRVTTGHIVGKPRSLQPAVIEE